MSNVQGNKLAFTSTKSQGMVVSRVNYTYLIEDRDQTFGSFQTPSLSPFPTSHNQ